MGYLHPVTEQLLIILHSHLSVKKQKEAPDPQVATELSRIELVMASVELILILHPSGAAENVKSLSLSQAKNFACGQGV